MKQVGNVIKNVAKIVFIAIGIIGWLLIIFNIGNVFVNMAVALLAAGIVIVICGVEDGMHQGEKIHSQEALLWAKIIVAVMVVISVLKMIIS